MESTISVRFSESKIDATLTTVIDALKDIRLKYVTMRKTVSIRGVPSWPAPQVVLRCAEKDLGQTCYVNSKVTQQCGAE